MIDETKATVEGNFEGSEVVYGDTDSVMVKFKMDESLTTEQKIAEAWKLGEKAADMCVFPPPNELELEKVYMPYILYSKKRYAAKMWVQNKKGEMELEKVDIKGLQVIRRDQSPFNRKVGKQILNILLESNDSAPALEYVMEKGKELLDGKVPNELLLETRSLKDDGFRSDLGTDPSVYETYNAAKSEKEQIKVYNKRNLPHVWVRDKMWERQPGSEPRQGERVSFLVSDTGNPKHKLFEKAEDPVYVEEKKVKLDYKYYFEKLKKPVNDLMAPVIGDKGDPLESLIPKITTVDQCETKEHINKFSAKDLREWCEKHITLPKGISKWKKPDWVHQVCVIKKINTATALETMFSFDNF
jgi:DNA polymerase delta subunit 1